MQTRVSRHNYEEQTSADSLRSKKNEKLYSLEYDDKINVPKISNGRELNEEEFKKIINQSQTRSMRVITKEDIDQFERNNNANDVEEKIYDINSVLENAKNNRKDINDDKYRVPKFEQIVSKNDNSDNNELLSDLMGGDDTIASSGTPIDTVIDKGLTITETKIDDSFYSKSMKFKSRDFASDDDEYDEKNEEKRPMSQVILTVVIVVLLIIAIVLGILVLSKIKF